MRRERYSKDNLTPLSSSFVCYFLNTFLEQKCAMIDFYTNPSPTSNQQTIGRQSLVVDYAHPYYSSSARQPRRCRFTLTSANGCLIGKVHLGLAKWRQRI